MAKRTAKRKYEEAPIEPGNTTKLDMVSIALKIPGIVDYLDCSMVKQHQVKPDWKLYRLEERNGIPYIVREMCDRCGKVFVPPRWRKLRVYDDEEHGPIYLETGLCKDCINAGTYVDKYLDGEALTEKEAKELFYKYAEDYERAWRIVIAAAPPIVMTEAEWQHRCKFFNGCAICGAHIEVRAKYFPTYLNGSYTAWNVIPMCNQCMKKHYAGRVTVGKTVKRYKVFSSQNFFNKSKTIRMYLLHEMEKHNIYMDPLIEYRQRFFETKVLEGSE